MIRQIIHIDEEKCSGCGACASACHEGAIGIIGGKAKLLRDDYCDGMGDCLPACPMGALSFENREAADYDGAAVVENKKRRELMAKIKSVQVKPHVQDMSAREDAAYVSQLHNFPVQIKLTPLSADYYSGASLLIAADCTAYCYAAFHRDFISGRVTLIGCPKLDSVDYSEKLTAILAGNNILDITLTRMTVPCCGGFEAAVKKAIAASGKDIPLNVCLINSNGIITK